MSKAKKPDSCASRCADEHDEPMLGFDLAPRCVIRVAGAPFEALEELASPTTGTLTHRVLAHERDVERAAELAVQATRKTSSALSDRELQTVRSAIGARLPLPAGARDQSFELYQSAHQKLDDARHALAKHLDEEKLRTLSSLQALAERWVYGYLFLASGSARDNLARFVEGKPRTSWEREEDAILRYLQRICAKCDTISAYGPTAWCRVDPKNDGLVLRPKPGIARRTAFVETWVFAALTDIMDVDPTVLEELPPCKHPSGVLEGTTFHWAHDGREVQLDPAEIHVLQNLDGRTPAYAIGRPETLASLHAKGVIEWQMRLPWLDVDLLGATRTIVSSWRDGMARRRWLGALATLDALLAQFVKEDNPAKRIQLCDAVVKTVEDCGGRVAERRGNLYEATNAIGEECSRAGDFWIGRDVADVLRRDAAPWVELWRLSFSHAAHSVTNDLRAVLHTTGHDSIPLVQFLRQCEAKGGYIQIQRNAARRAFGEIGAALEEMYAPMVEQQECPFGPQQVRALRERIQTPILENHAWPSLDVQIAAPSCNAVADGHYELVLSELHMAYALSQNVFLWSFSQTDLDGFAEDWTRALGEQPAMWFFEPRFSRHTVPRFVDLHRDGTKPVILQRASFTRHPVVLEVSETDVYAAADGDVRIRRKRDGSDIASLSRDCFIPQHYHPFFPLVLSHHTPRLRNGRVIFQRQRWIIKRDELSLGKQQTAAWQQMLAVARIRERRALPRYVFVRPTDRALQQSQVVHDKDRKPIYVDLESPPFVRLLIRWLRRYDELIVVEMLPRPEDLCWHEADGTRRTFELRWLTRAPGRDGPEEAAPPRSR